MSVVRVEAIRCDGGCLLTHTRGEMITLPTTRQVARFVYDHRGGRVYVSTVPDGKTTGTIDDWEPLE